MSARVLRGMLAALVFAGALSAAGAASAQPQILVVDLGDAYTRSTALAGLIADVDLELKAVAKRHRPELLALRREIAELRKQGDTTRDRQLAAARRIEAIDAAAEQEEEILALANQAAIAKVNAQIAQIKRELAAEVGAKSVLDVQETMYVRAGCACDYTGELYARLNAQLPHVAMDLAREPEPSS